MVIDKNGRAQQTFPGESIACAHHNMMIDRCPGCGFYWMQSTIDPGCCDVCRGRGPNPPQGGWDHSMSAGGIEVVTERKVNQW